MKTEIFQNLSLHVALIMDLVCKQRFPLIYGFSLIYLSKTGKCLIWYWGFGTEPVIRSRKFAPTKSKFSQLHNLMILRNNFQIVNSFKSNFDNFVHVAKICAFLCNKFKIMHTISFSRSYDLENKLNLLYMHYFAYTILLKKFSTMLHTTSQIKRTYPF